MCGGVGAAAFIAQISVNKFLIKRHKNRVVLLSGLLMKGLWQLKEPSEADFYVPIKVFGIFIHARKMLLLKGTLRP